MTSNPARVSATPPPAEQATMTELQARGGTAPDTRRTRPAPQRRRRAAAALAMLAVPLAVTALDALPAAATTGPYSVTTIGVGKWPDAVGVDPNTHTAYVANGWDDTVS